ncbi:hypothetical protein [Ruminococcus gauvreauii]|uniref:Uncharacterized protein n=1 Tax=Ruminococcus gauvreauii TaxID=438033 RepID=A0ABY5VHQ2_9FIRM|nr:hypothetical protein [Ruminococcus gauvreauii]UWP59927.1 hypothetical protein NQ502_02380 [Ruminococcus gauvreauii]
MRKYFQLLSTAMKMEVKEHRSSFIVYAILRILVVLSMIRQFFNGNYENVFLCLLTLLLLIVPSFIQVKFRIELPTALEIIILLFIFAAEILGEIQEFYIIIPFWDTLLHTLNGFLAAAIGFSLVVLLNDNQKLVFTMSPVFIAIVAFCFSMTIGVIWEFFECAMDLFFHLDMQKDTVLHTISSVMLDPAGGNKPYVIRGIQNTVVNGQDLGIGGYLDIGLLDTMKDLFVNFIGAAVFSLLGFFYVKNRGTDSILKKFIPSKKTREQDYLEAAREDYEKQEEEKENRRQEHDR